MAPRRSARILAANQASTAAAPTIRRAAFLRAVEAISVVRSRRATTTANQRPANQRPANQRPANQRPANQRPTNQRPANQRAANQRVRPDTPRPRPFNAVVYLDDDDVWQTRDNLTNFDMLYRRFAAETATADRAAAAEAVTAGRAFAAEALTAGRAVAAQENPMATEKGLRRLRREMQIMTTHPTDGCTVELVDNCIYEWRAFILGPSDTPYEGGQFELRLRFPQTYPSEPPYVVFRTKVYHCNIYQGAICVDILRSEWSPALTVEKILLSIRSLLADPNPESPLNCDAAEMYKTDREQHDRLAREWTARFAQLVDLTSE